MGNKDTNYRTKSNRTYETISSDESGTVYITRQRNFIMIPLGILCAAAGAFFILISAVTGFDVLLAVFALCFTLLAFASFFAGRMKITADRNGITYSSLFRSGKFQYSDVEKFTARDVKQVLVYYSFIKIPVGTEHEFMFCLKGRKSPLRILFVHDSRSVRFVEDCLIEKELAEMEELFRSESLTLEWQHAFLRSLRDEKAVPQPQLFGLRHLLINALYICGPSSPFHTFTGPHTTLPPEHVESWIRDGYLKNTEADWYQKWYSQLPSDWKEKWLSCIEEYAANNAFSDSFDRIRIKIRGIRSNLQQ